MSKIIRLFVVASSAALFAAPALAQAPAPSPAAAEAPMPMPMPMPKDCRNRHDHGAEKGMPTPKSAMCADMPASAVKAQPRTPKTRVHDHAKFHKNQG